MRQPARKAAKPAAKKANGSASGTKPTPSREQPQAAKKRTAAKTTAAKTAAKPDAAKTTAAKTAAKTGAAKPAKKPAPARKATADTAVKAPAKAPARSRLSAADRKEFTELISTELNRVREEYDRSMVILDELKNAGQDSAGDDPADAGAKTFEREQEMSLANNRLDLIAQMERALRRIEDGSYGVCESCGKLIPKGRLQAFPQATLCVECKQREERR